MDILGCNVNFSSFYILHDIYKICLKYHLVSDMFGISWKIAGVTCRNTFVSSWIKWNEFLIFRYEVNKIMLIWHWSEIDKRNWHNNRRRKWDEHTYYMLQPDTTVHEIISMFTENFINIIRVIQKILKFYWHFNNTLKKIWLIVNFLSNIKMQNSINRYSYFKRKIGTDYLKWCRSSLLDITYIVDLISSHLPNIAQVQ